jgi:hypothetical protein
MTKIFMGSFCGVERRAAFTAVVAENVLGEWV